MKKRIVEPLSTADIERLDRTCPLKEYPRPQFRRDSYISLNGEWDYTISSDPSKRAYDGKILVPYCLESMNSGVGKTLKKGDCLIYHKTVSLEKEWIRQTVLLHIGGIDQECDLIVNEIAFPHLISLNLPLEIDITEAIHPGNNELIIICRDDLKSFLPHGKQVREPKGMFYTAVSGIYFPVFIESIGKNAIRGVKMSPSLRDVTFEIETEAPYTLTILDDLKPIFSLRSETKIQTIEIPSPHLWSLEDPHLYDVIIETEDDRIRSYFGMREIGQKDGFVYLNGKKIFLNGILDQGYYPEGIFTVSDYRSYETDIRTMKKLGFNLLRKHVKIESDYFYYLCDRIGMLVLQDFVCNSDYRFLYETALPTIGFQKFGDLHARANLRDRIYFLRHAFRTQTFLYNHPCVIAYTIFNEGWGQFKSDALYDKLKARDPSRLYDSASGWFRQKKSDFESLHIYFADISKTIKKRNCPVFLSEFGGFSFKISGHAFNLKNTYGYRYYEDPDSFQNALIELYRSQILKNKENLVGCIYTQVSDVEDETNGLFTYDRKVLKIEPERLRSVFSELTEISISNGTSDESIGK